MMSLALNNWAQYLMVQCFNILNFFFLIFPRKQLRHFMHIVSLGCFLRKKKNNNKQKTSVFAYRVVKVNLIVFLLFQIVEKKIRYARKMWNHWKL